MTPYPLARYAWIIRILYSAGLLALLILLATNAADLRTYLMV